MKIEEIMDRNAVIHCDTEEKAKLLLEYLHSIGRKWCSGKSYIEENHYSSYGDQTCYAIYLGQYGSLGWYQNDDDDDTWVIYEFDDVFYKCPIVEPEIKINFDDLFKE